MINDFKEIYLNILYEQQGTVDFNLEEYADFLKSGIYFDKNGDVIEEDRSLSIDVPDSLIEHCLANQNKLISFSQIEKLMKDSKHSQNLKKNSPAQLYFSIFDFNDLSEIRSFHYRFFKIKDEETMQNAVRHFNNNVKSTGGFFNMFKNIGVCIVNSSSDIYKISNHELGHFLQEICGIRILGKEISTGQSKESSIEKLKYLGITLEDFQYYTSNREFYPHIDSLVIGLRKTYHRFYKGQTLFLFFNNTVLKTIMTEKPENILKTDFVKKYAKANNNDFSELAMFIASYYLKVKFQKIRDIVFQSLKSRL